MIVSKNDILNVRRKIDWDYYMEKVKPIVERVKREGDKALIDFTMSSME